MSRRPAGRRACRSPRTASAISPSAIFLVSFALASVVSMRSCRISDATNCRKSAVRSPVSRPSFRPLAPHPIVRATPLLFLPQFQTEDGELLFYLVQRLPAEVLHVDDLLFCALHQVADRVDPGALQAVVGTHGEVQFLDGHGIEAAQFPVRPALPRLRLPLLADASEEAEVVDQYAR